jgi:hypothetical protein
VRKIVIGNPLVIEVYDLREAFGVQTGTTDQGAVDVRLSHQVAYVFGLDGAAVLDADLVAGSAEAVA